jgi:hypothetical protein
LQPLVYNTHVVTGRSQVSDLTTAGHHMRIVNHCKVASCWLFLLSHTTMHGSMNIKLNNSLNFENVSLLAYDTTYIVNVVPI